MAADQERADRIRALKKEHPEYTWQVIADRVGVSLRAAQSWQEKGGIEYENAKKLAELWGEDLDYIMRGPRADVPDLSRVLDGDAPQLDRIETLLTQLVAGQEAGLAAVAELAEAVVALQHQAAPARRAAS